MTARVPSVSDAELTQRLAAILAADVAGYSRLMHDEEPATVASPHREMGLIPERIETHKARASHQYNY